MPVLTKSFSERDPSVLGIFAIATIVVVVMGALNAANIRDALTQRRYTAEFSDAGGLRTGDDVRLAGMTVGRVRDIAIEGRTVSVEFRLDKDVRLGTSTTAAIKSATVLGRKFLQVTPVGRGRLDDDATIPISRTHTPYDVQARLEGLGQELKPLDKDQLASALDTVSATLRDTPAEVRAALDGVRRASRVVTARDTALLQLLESASQVTGILADRSGQVTTLVRQANDLLAELTMRRDALRAVLVNTQVLLTQLRGLANDNARQIAPALQELGQVAALLKRNNNNITALIEGLKNYTGSLGEAVNGGPWFYGYISNIVPSNMAQQTVQSILEQAGGPEVTN